MKKIFVPLILGTLVGLISSNFTNFDTLITPEFYPPSYVFQIVWPILYLLMGISYYLISKEENNEQSVFLFKTQLVLNLLWPFIFSYNYFIAFILLLCLIIVVILMMIEFFKINKLAFYLQIPYLIWLFIALYLNYQIFVLN